LKFKTALLVQIKCYFFVVFSFCVKHYLILVGDIKWSLGCVVV